MISDLYELKDYLGLGDIDTEDTPLTICLTAADAIMRNYCNRNFESTRYNRFLTPSDTCTLLVPDIPLTAVHGMTAFQSMDDTVGMVLNTTYLRFLRSGYIYSVEGYFVNFINSVQVDYTAGFHAEDPEWESLRWLQVEIASELYRGRGLLNMAQYQSGGAQMQRFDLPADFIAMLSPEVLVMLNMHAVRGPRVEY